MLRRMWEQIVPGLFWEEDSTEGRTPDVIVADLSAPAPAPPDPPDSDTAAAYELGQTREAVQNLRREVTEQRDETARQSAGLADLAETVSGLVEDLRQLREEELRKVEQETQTTRASFWETFLGHH